MKVIKLMLIASLSTLLSTIVIGCSDTSKNETASVTVAEETTVDTAAVVAVAIHDVKPQACTDDWYAKIDSQLISGDGQGHGPDLGSQEWRSVIEFKLGIRGDANVPARNSALWCDYVNKLNTAI